MKTTLSILFFTLVSFSLMAQSGNFPEKYRTFYLGAGPRVLKTDPGTFTLSYIDESPSMDQIQSTVEVEDKYSKLGIEFGFAWGKYSGLSHDVNIGIDFGENGGGMFNYSLGYNFPFEVGPGTLIVRPGILVGFGNYGFDAGEIVNNAGYIEINSIQYYDPSLYVKLKSQSFVYGPKVDLMYVLGEHINIFAHINYNLGGDNSNPKVQFSPDKNNDENSTSIEIDAPNLDVTYNGEAFKSLPYDLSGIRLTVGVGYLWNRN